MRGIAHLDNATMIQLGGRFVGTKTAGYEGDGHDVWLSRALATVLQLQADQVEAQGTQFIAGSCVVRAHSLDWEAE